MYDEGWKNLANAIILQAVKDFKPAYKRLRRHPNDKVAQNQVRELTRFFCSDYFATLTELDGPTLLNRIMREMDEKGKP
jgi:hypothetical protein|nr:MAG TPA: hypothetical protein [Caudoviricetes sp.]